MKQRIPKHGRSANGYALLVTLIMLALLAVILGGLARRSADTALQANDAEQAMRQRWAQRSCSYTLLTTARERADKRFDAWRASQQADEFTAVNHVPPVRSEAFHIQLAGLDVWGRIDDEQAKINLNARLASSPDARVSPERVIDEVLRPIRSTGVQLTSEPFVQQLGLPRVASWAQVLPGFQPPELLAIQNPGQLLDVSRTESVVDRVSLWGNGQLNIWTADGETLRRHLSGSVSPNAIDEFVRLRDGEPALDLATLIASATEDKQERDRLASALSEQSACYGLWLAIRPSKWDNARIEWSMRVIESPQDNELKQIQEYHW